MDRLLDVVISYGSEAGAIAECGVASAAPPYREGLSDSNLGSGQLSFWPVFAVRTRVQKCRETGGISQSCIPKSSSVEAAVLPLISVLAEININSRQPEFVSNIKTMSITPILSNKACAFPAGLFRMY